MTNRSKWIAALPFSFIVSLAIPAIAVSDAWWFTQTPARILFASLSFGMWVAATAFVDVERPRGDRDLANLLLPLALILVPPLAVYDHSRLLAASMPGSIVWVGVLVGGLAIALGLVARRYLGRSYAPSAFRPADEALVQAGPYRWIRHPLYAAALLWMVGWPLILGSFLSAGVALILTVPAILKRIRTEEAEMVRRFGAEYEAYRGKTWRFLPYVY